MNLRGNERNPMMRFIEHFPESIDEESQRICGWLHLLSFYLLDPKFQMCQGLVVPVGDQHWP